MDNEFQPLFPSNSYPPNASRNATQPASSSALSDRPGSLRADIANPLPRPRSEALYGDPAFFAQVRRLRGAIGGAG